MVAALGPRSVQINGFCRPGEHDVLRRLADEIAAWDKVPQAQMLLAHVSAPTLPQEHAWLAAGFSRVGVRARVERAVSTHGLPDDSLPPGVKIFPLCDEPQLADAVLQLWNECHTDIPSALPFETVTNDAWRADLGIAADAPYPPALLIAATAEREIVGVAFLDIDAAQGIAGHRFTGTARSWRGQGVAIALKVATIRWAAANGVTLLRASNDADNLAMRTVNDRLGYEEQHRIVLFQRTIATPRFSA